MVVLLLPFLLPFTIYIAQDVRRAFWLMLFFIPFSMNLQERIGIGIDFPDEPFMLFLSWVCLLHLFYPHHRKGIWNWLKHPLVLVILAILVWTLITVLFSQDSLFSLKYFVKRLWYILPFLVFGGYLFGEEGNERKAFMMLFIPLLFIILLVLYRFRELGFRFEEVHDPIQPFFQNHVMYGSMISSVVPLVFAAWWIQKPFHRNWILLLAAIGIFLAGIYFSYSRAAWMAVLFAIVTMVAIRFKIMHYLLLCFYAIVLAGVLWLSHQNQYLNYRPRFEKTIMHESLTDHIMATLQGTDISSAERYYRWIAAVRMSQDHPLVGVGPNNFYDYYKQYTITSYRTWVSRNPERSTTHNYFLYMLVEQGYPGMIGYAFLLLALFWYGQRAWHQSRNKNERRMLMGVLGMMAAIFINNFFSELLETDKIGSLFLLGLAFIIRVDVKNRANQKEAVSLR